MMIHRVDPPVLASVSTVQSISRDLKDSISRTSRTTSADERLALVAYLQVLGQHNAYTGKSGPTRGAMNGDVRKS